MHGRRLVGIDLDVSHLGKGGTKRLLWGVSARTQDAMQKRLTTPMDRVAARRPRARREKDMAGDGAGVGGGRTVGRITIFCGGQCGGRLDGAGAGRIAVLRGLPRGLICFLLFLLFYPGMFTPLGVDGAGLIRRCTQMMKAPLDEVARMHGDAQDGVYVYEDETSECIKPFC